ncbi:MAG: tetratricopeptide repeat protein [Pseudonocardiaceae bacterium]
MQCTVRQPRRAFLSHTSELLRDHPDTLMSANNLATDLRGLEHHELAFRLDEDTLVCRRRILGEGSPPLRWGLISAPLAAGGRRTTSSRGRCPSGRGSEPGPVRDGRRPGVVRDAACRPFVASLFFAVPVVGVIVRGV